MNNSSQAIQPKVPIRGLYDSGDPPKRFLIRVDGMKSPMIESLQSKFTANPNLRSASMNGQNVTYLNALSLVRMPVRGPRRVQLIVSS